MNVWIKCAAALTLLSGPLLYSPADAAPAPAQDALTALASRPSGPLPAGTRLLSVKLASGLATANFSRELRDNFGGGDTQETRTVNAVLTALGRFPTVDRVQILVEGKPLETLGGLLTLSKPLPVLRPAAPSILPTRSLPIPRGPRA